MILVRLSGDLERTGTILPPRLKIVLYGTITAASGAAEDTPRGHLFATGARLELLGGSSDPLSNAFAFMAAVAVVALLISLWGWL